MPKRRKKPRLPVLGWREWVALPGLGIGRVKAKVDTGARSSALHAVDLHPFERHGALWIAFRVHPVQRSRAGEVRAEAPLEDERWVRSSTGRSTLRPVIVTELAVDGQAWPIEVTLVDRDVMGFRMLLGRSAVRRRFLVDPGRSFLADKRSQLREAKS